MFCTVLCTPAQSFASGMAGLEILGRLWAMPLLRGDGEECFASLEGMKVLLGSNGVECRGSRDRCILAGS